MDYQIRTRTNKAGDIRYSVVVEVWVNGERTVISGGTHDDEELARRAGIKLLMQYEDDGDKLKAVHGTQALREWADEWLEGLSTKGSTTNAYRWRMEKWVLPSLGDFMLKNLTSQVIDRWINGTKLSHLSKSSKQAALDCLRSCLKKAVKQGLINQNPCRSVSLEMTKAQVKAEKIRKKIKTWNYEEVEALLTASEGMPVEPLIVLGLLAGLRPGESMVVRWSDINWLDGTVEVSRTRSRAHQYDVISDTTKTGDTRNARLTSDAVMRLMRIKESREATGEVDPDAIIYGSSLKNQATSWRQLVALCKKAGVRQLTLHCLRHTHASLLLENGATLAAVAKQLGHSNPTITASVYWHLIDEQVDTISGVMDKALRKRVGLVEKVEEVQQ